MTLEVLSGDNIYLACKKAVTLSQTKNTYIDFTFNDIKMTAAPESSNVDLVTIYYLKDKIRKLELKLSEEIKNEKKIKVRS